MSLLVPLRDLRALHLKLGGTRNSAVLPELAHLEYLELWMVKGLADLSPVADLHQLEYLFLQSLTQVFALPDLSPVVDARALRHLAVVDMGHLQPAAFGPLVGHPTLATLRYGLGRRRKNDAVQLIIDLPRDGDWHKPFG